MSVKKVFHRSRAFWVASGIVLCLVTGGFIFWRNYKYKLVNKKLDKLVTVPSKGLYQINYEHLVIDEAWGNISAENIEMIPDSTVYNEMEKQKTAPESLFYIKIPHLLVYGVKTPKALLKKEISAHMIKIQNADIVIRLGSAKKGKQSDFMNTISPDNYRQLLGNLKSITADSIILENASLTLVDREPQKVRYKASGLSIRFAATAIDSLYKNDSNRILFSREMTVQCSQLKMPSKNKTYEFEVNGFDYNSQTGNLHTEEIGLKPILTETAFAKANKFAKDRFYIRIGQLDVRNINRQGMLSQQLMADTLQIRDASIHVFRDKSYPHDSVDRTHDYPQEAIMRLPFPVYIKKILVKDSYIEYKEKNDKSDSSGKVAFFNVQAAFDNVTNIPFYIKLNNQMRLDFNSSFLNVTPFKAIIHMRLDDRKGNFNLDARLGGIKAEHLNPLLKPMALAELNKGEIHSLHYHLDATNTSGKGRLVMTYDKLSVKLLKKDDDKNKYKTKVLPTLAAGILLKDSNPTDGRTRTGQVDYKRDIHRSIFNLMWKSMFTAIKQVVL